MSDLWGLHTAADSFTFDGKPIITRMGQHPPLEEVWKDFSDWKNQDAVNPENPEDAIQGWDNIEDYMRDRHGVSPHSSHEAAQNFFNHPVVLALAKLHTLAQDRREIHGYGNLDDDELLTGAGLGLLKIRRNNHTASTDGIRYAHIVEAAADEYHQIDEWGNHARDGHWNYADPDVNDHMNGNCWEWALWHQKLNPHLRIGQEWEWQHPDDRDHPDDEWIPIHAFTHDDHWAYDARGAFPLSEWRKWKGWDDVTFNHTPRDIGGSDTWPPEGSPTLELAARNKPRPPLPTAPEMVKDRDGVWRVAKTARGGGDCYQAAGRYILDNPTADVHLVHGDVDGRGAIAGTRMGHAWIEDGDDVIDRSNGREVRLPKAVYYALGNIGNAVRYTPSEAMERMGETGHFGPWHETGAAHSTNGVVDHGTEWDEPEDEPWDAENGWIGSGPPDDDHHTARRTAMPAPLPKGVTFHYYPDRESMASRPRGDKPLYAPAVEARLNDKHVGFLEWFGAGDEHYPHGEINMIQVVPRHRRKGIATALFDFARQHDPAVKHSPGKTDLGQLWADYEEFGRRRAMAVLPEGHEGPAEPTYDPGDADNYDPSQHKPTPEKSTWYHVSPHKLEPGTVLIPGGGDSVYNEDGFYEHPNMRARRRWVWLEHDPVRVEGWMDDMFDTHIRGYSNHPTQWDEEDKLDDEPPLYVYRVRPHHPPQPWDGWGSQGWVTGAATVLGPYMEETGSYFDRVRKPVEASRRTAAPQEDPFDAHRRRAAAAILHLHHYLTTGEHPGGFGPTIAIHPQAHHPELTNFWAAEVMHPESLGGPFGDRVQHSTNDYVHALTGVADEKAKPSALDDLEGARNKLRVDLQHGGHFQVPDLREFSRLSRQSDALKLPAVNPRLFYGMEGPNEAHKVGYQINCQRCCLALDARHRGLNVEARPNYYDPKGDPLNSDEQWTDDYLAALWRDEHGGDSRWIDADDQFQLTRPSPAHWDQMHDHIASWGPGARALVAMTQRDPTKKPGAKDELFRHVIMAHVGSGGNVRFIDPQSADTDASDWRDRIMYGYYPKGVFKPEHRAKAEREIEGMGGGDADKLMARNFLYSPLRYMRIDDKRLSQEAAQHLVDRGTAGPSPIIPGGYRQPPKPEPPSAGSVFL